MCRVVLMSNNSLKRSSKIYRPLPACLTAVKLNYPSFMPCVPRCQDNVNPIACLEYPLTHAHCVGGLYGYRVTRSDLAPRNVWLMLFLKTIRSYGDLPVGSSSRRSYIWSLQPSPDALRRDGLHIAAVIPKQPRKRALPLRVILSL